MRIEMAGDRAVLRHGYQVAARFDRWTAITEQTTLGAFSTTITAQMVWANDFWVRQRPVEIALSFGRGSAWWTWPVTRLTGDPAIIGAPLTLVVGGHPTIRQEI